jgi:hypothetical protein
MPRDPLTPKAPTTNPECADSRSSPEAQLGACDTSPERSDLLKHLDTAIAENMDTALTLPFPELDDACLFMEPSPPSPVQEAKTNAKAMGSASCNVIAGNVQSPPGQSVADDGGAVGVKEWVAACHPVPLVLRAKWAGERHTKAHTIVEQETEAQASNILKQEMSTAKVKQETKAEASNILKQEMNEQTSTTVKQEMETEARKMETVKDEILSSSGEEDNQQRRTISGAFQAKSQIKLCIPLVQHTCSSMKVVYEIAVVYRLCFLCKHTDNPCNISRHYGQHT